MGCYCTTLRCVGRSPTGPIETRCPGRELSNAVVEVGIVRKIAEFRTLIPAFIGVDILLGGRRQHGLVKIGKLWGLAEACIWKFQIDTSGFMAIPENRVGEAVKGIYTYSSADLVTTAFFELE